MTSELPFEIPEELLHHLGEGVTLANASGRIVFSNRAADRILGVEASDAPPEEWAKHYGVFLQDGETPFPTDEYPLVRALAGEETRGVEMFIRNPNVPDGALLSVTGSPIRGAEGEIVGASVVFTDITALRTTQRVLEETNEELRRTQRLKDELAAFVVHDLKSPLTAIMLNAAMLIDDPSLDGHDLDTLEEIQDSAKTLHRMVMDLLDTRLAEEGRLELELAQVCVGDVLNEVGRAVGSAAAATDQTLRVEDRASGLTVLADQQYLRRIIQNLTDNCLKYTPAGGTITMAARAGENGSVLIEISDNGPGVPPEYRERIFDMYAKIERDEEGRHRDSRGLGLRFCRLAVEAHGGRLWVEDNDPKGARFCVELPAP